MSEADGECVHSYIERKGCYKVGWLGKLLPAHSTPCFVSLYDLKLLNFRNNKGTTFFEFQLLLAILLKGGNFISYSYFELNLLHCSVLSNVLLWIIEWALWEGGLVQWAAVMIFNHQLLHKTQL